MKRLLILGVLLGFAQFSIAEEKPGLESLSICGDIPFAQISPEAQAAVEWIANEAAVSGSVDIHDLKIFEEAGFTVQQEIHLRSLILNQLYELKSVEKTYVYSEGLLGLASATLGLLATELSWQKNRREKRLKTFLKGSGFFLVQPVAYLFAIYQILNAHDSRTKVQKLDQLIEAEKGKLEYLESASDRLDVLAEC